MKKEEAKVGMRVYANDDGSTGTIAYISPMDNGCDVDFDDGTYTWIECEEISKLDEESKKKKEGWLNIFKGKGPNRRYTDEVYPTKERALYWLKKNKANKYRIYLATIKIEWEEEE